MPSENPPHSLSDSTSEREQRSAGPPSDPSHSSRVAAEGSRSGRGPAPQLPSTHPQALSLGLCPADSKGDHSSPEREHKRHLGPTRLIISWRVSSRVAA